MKVNSITIAVFFIFINCSAHLSWAGDHKGNGADIVSCNEQSLLLDFFENEVNPTIDGPNEIDIAINLLNQIKYLSPFRVQTYQGQILNFYNETRFVSENDLGEIFDSGEMVKKIPESCKLVQGILQKKTIFGNEKRYLINQKEWERLPNLHKAGAILHEVIYRELQSLTSQKIRKFNGWLFNKINQKIDPHEFYDQIKQTGFQWVYLYQIPFNAQYLVTNEKNIRSLSTYPGLKFNIFNSEVETLQHFVDSFSNGRPKLIKFKNIINFEDSHYQIIFCKDQPTCNIHFDENGSVRKINHATVFIKDNGELFNDKAVEFSKEGKVEGIL